MKTNAGQAHTQRKHARLSPSKAATWSVCTASVSFIERLLAEKRIKPDTSSAAADEGTLAHEVCEALLLAGKMPANATSEMLRHGKAYRAFCLELAGNKPWKVEAKAPLWYDPTEHNKGHVDFAAWDTTGAVIVDYKFGKGKFVHAKENKQLAIYAAAILYDQFGEALPDTYQVTMAIYQPRCAIDGVPHTIWSVSWSELRLFVTRNIEIPASVITNPAAQHLLKFVPREDVCFWCPARRQSQCEAYARYLLDATGIEAIVDGENPRRPMANELSDKAIATVVSRFTELTQWINGVYELAEHRFASGQPVEGLKQVKGKRPPRVWRDPEAAAEYFGMVIGDDAFNKPAPKLLTPAQLEDLLEEKGYVGPLKDIAEFAKRGDARTEIVAASDDRPALNSPMDALVAAIADDEFDFGL